MTVPATTRARFALRARRRPQSAERRAGSVNPPMLPRSARTRRRPRLAGMRGRLHRGWQTAGVEGLLTLMVWVFALSDATTDAGTTATDTFRPEAATWDSLLLATLLPAPLWWRRRRPGTALIAGTALAIAFYLRLPAELNPAPLTPWLTIALLAWAAGCYVVDVRQVWRAAGVAAGVSVALGAVTAEPSLWLAAPAVTIIFVLFGRHVGQTRQRVRADSDLRIAQARDEALWAHAQDRVRIARDLHDAVGHQLTVIAVQAAASRRILDAAADRELDRAIEAVEEASRRSLEDLRATVRSLQEGPRNASASLADLPLLIGAVRSTGATLEVEHVGLPQALDESTSAAAFRVAQEALTNCLRHAPGARIKLELRWPDGTEPGVHPEHPGRAPLTVTVRNGPPALAVIPQPTPASVPGTGLAGLRARVQECQGRLEFGQLPDGGFEVRAVLPLADQTTAKDATR